jgi:DNA polymerase III delta subunit
MPEITIAIGSKENITQDIHGLATSLDPNPRTLLAAGKEMKGIIVEKASALFLEGNLVLVLLDPDEKLLQEMGGQLDTLKERIHVVIYQTKAGQTSGEKTLAGNTVVLETQREKRIEERVRNFLRTHGKKMTNDAFRVLKERLKDEAMLDAELTKLLNYVGERREIRSKDVQAMVTDTQEESLIDLFEALSIRDRKKALEVFQNLLMNGLPILAVHSFLLRQARLLLQAKDMEEVFKEYRDYPAFAKSFAKWKEAAAVESAESKHYLPFQKAYPAFKLSRTGQKMSMKTLLAFMDALAKFDVKVKTGTKHDRVRLECSFLEV